MFKKKKWLYSKEYGSCLQGEWMMCSGCVPAAEQGENQLILGPHRHSTTGVYGYSTRIIVRLYVPSPLSLSGGLVGLWGSLTRWDHLLSNLHLIWPHSRGPSIFTGLLFLVIRIVGTRSSQSRWTRQRAQARGRDGGLGMLSWLIFLQVGELVHLLQVQLQGSKALGHDTRPCVQEAAQVGLSEQLPCVQSRRTWQVEETRVEIRYKFLYFFCSAF